MGSLLVCYQRVTVWLVLSSMIYLGIASSANAQVGMDGGLENLCGAISGNAVAPMDIDLKAGNRLVVLTINMTALNGKKDDLQRLREQVVVKLVRPDGSTVWTRILAVTSFHVADVREESEGFELRFPKRLNTIWRQFVPIFQPSGICVKVGKAIHDDREYIIVAAGVTSYDSERGPEGQVITKDWSAMNVWTLLAANGNIVRTFRPRPQPNWVILPGYSHVRDIDNDDNHELVLTRGKFNGLNAYDFKYESFNIISGKLESRTNTRQFHRKVFK